MINSRKLIIGATLVASVALTAHADSKVIDLGEMSVNGEIRRPSITWIDSQKPVKEALPGMYKAEFEAFEAKLLEPAVAETEERGPKK